MRRESPGRRVSLLAAWLVFAVAGCSDNGPVGLDSQFEASQIAGALESLGTSADGDATAIYLPIVSEALLYAGGGAALVSAKSPQLGLDMARSNRLADVRSVLDRSLPALVAGRSEAVVRAAAAASQHQIIPDTLRGRTMVLQMIGGYTLAGMGGPADGVRFVTYELDPLTSRPKTIPLNANGHLDLIDWSDTSLRLGVQAERKNGHRIADLVVEGSYSLTETDLISDFSSEGFIASGPRVDYSLRDLFALTGGGQQLEILFQREVAIPERGWSATASLGGVITSDPGDPGLLDFYFRLTDGTNTAVLDATIDDIQANGTLSYNGQVKALISGDPLQPTFRHPDGTALDVAEHGQLERIWFAADYLLLFGDPMMSGLTFLFLEE